MTAHAPGEVTVAAGVDGVDPEFLRLFEAGRVDLRATLAATIDSKLESFAWGLGARMSQISYRTTQAETVVKKVGREVAKLAETQDSLTKKLEKLSAELQRLVVRCRPAAHPDPLGEPCGATSPRGGGSRRHPASPARWSSHSRRARSRRSRARGGLRGDPEPSVQLHGQNNGRAGRSGCGPAGPGQKYAIARCVGWRSGGEAWHVALVGWQWQAAVWLERVMGGSPISQWSGTPATTARTGSARAPQGVVAELGAPESDRRPPQRGRRYFTASLEQAHPTLRTM